MSAMSFLQHLDYHTIRVHRAFLWTRDYRGVEGDMDQVMCRDNGEMGRADHVVSGVVKMTRKELQ